LVYALPSAGSETPLRVVAFGNTESIIGVVSVGTEGAALHARGRKSVQIAIPGGSRADLSAKRSTRRHIREIASGTVDNARHDSCAGIKVAPVALRIVTLRYASVGGVIDVERDGDGGTLGDVGADTYAGHISVEHIVLGA